MATVSKWSNVAVAMQSALASPKTITAITQGATCTISSTSHGYSNGDYIKLTIQGMAQLDARVVRVASTASDSWVAEGIDSSSFTAFSSGSSEKITFGTSVTTVTGVSSGDGDFGFEDTTTIHVAQRSQVPQLPNPASYTMEHIWDPSDAGQVALKSASEAQAQRAFRLTFGSGGKITVFVGYVGFSGAPGGQAQGKVTTSSVITMFGAATNYAS